MEDRIRGLTADMAQRPDTSGNKFRVKIGEKTFTERGPAGDVLLAALDAARKSGNYGTQDIGEFAGMALVVRSSFGHPDMLLRSDNGIHYPINGGDTGIGFARSMELTLDKLPKLLEYSQDTEAALKDEFVALSQNIEKPFEYAKELAAAIERKEEIDTALGLYKQDEQAVGEATETPETGKAEDEATEDLVDLDALTSIDADWSTKADVEVVQDLTPLEPTPEVIAALEKMGFKEQAQQAVSQAEAPEVSASPEAAPVVEPAAPAAPEPQPVAQSLAPPAPESQPQSAPQRKQELDPSSWPVIAAALDHRAYYQEAVIDRVSNHQPGEPWDQRVMVAFQKDLGRFNAELNGIREWYRTAVNLGKDDEHLANIRSVGEAYKQGHPVQPEHQQQRIRDHNQMTYKQLTERCPETPDAAFVFRLATEAARNQFESKQVMQVLKFAPYVKDLQETQGEQASLKFSREAMLHGLRQHPQSSTAKFPSPQQNQQRGIHR